MPSFIKENADRIDLPNTFLEKVCERICRVVPVEEIYIFGSYARGEQRPDSDVDIYVVLDDSIHDIFDALSKADAALMQICSVQQIDYDLIGNVEHVYRSQLEDRAILPFRIAREGVKIYDN